MQELYLIRNTVVEHLSQQIDSYYFHTREYNNLGYARHRAKTIKDYLKVYYLLDKYCDKHAQAEGSQAFNKSIVLEAHAVLRDNRRWWLWRKTTGYISMLTYDYVRLPIRRLRRKIKYFFNGW